MILTKTAIYDTNTKHKKATSNIISQLVNLFNNGELSKS